MDRLILEQLNQTNPPPKLARLESARAVLVSAYVPGKEYPVWFAKHTTNDALRNRLRRERQALVHLSPHAKQLGIPQILGWKDDESGSLLIREGLSGETSPMAILLTAPQEVYEKHFDSSVEWLLRFQKTVSPPEAISQRAVAERSIQWLRQHSSVHPAMERMALAITALLPGPEKPAVAVHGDFFPRNVLLGSFIQVIDWDCFGSGLPLTDLLNLFTGADLYQGKTMVPQDQIATAALFSRMPIRNALFRYIERLGAFEPADIALNTYCYLASKLELTAGGIDEQFWLRLLETVDRAGYPMPGTVLTP